MGSLYVRNVPQDLYDDLKKIARAHGRTLREEVLAILEEELDRVEWQLEIQRKARAVRDKLTSLLEQGPLTLETLQQAIRESRSENDANTQRQKDA